MYQRTLRVQEERCDTRSRGAALFRPGSGNCVSRIVVYVRMVYVPQCALDLSVHCDNGTTFILGSDPNC